LSYTQKKNPSSREFSKQGVTPIGVLLKAKRLNGRDRNMIKVGQAMVNPDQYPQNFATCWMCWMDLARENLEDWRKMPWSEMGSHGRNCPLCGYPRWKGRMWYPFKKLKGYFGNPSSRWGHDQRDTIGNR